MKAAPTVVVTGQRRAGLSLLHAMLRAGGIPEARALVGLADEGATPGPGVVLAPDPHAVNYHRPHPVLGLFVERSTGEILKSVQRHNAETGLAPLTRIEKRIIFRSVARDFRSARDAAVAAFAPVVMFQFESIMTDPGNEAARLSHLVFPWWPNFDIRGACLAVRRIYRAPKVVTVTPRELPSEAKS